MSVGETEDNAVSGGNDVEDNSVVKSNENEDGNSTDNSTGNGNASNAEDNNSQNQSGILFPIASETSHTESYLISLIKTTGKEKNYELIEYINDVNREYAEVLVEQNINGALDTAYVYGAAIGTGSDRLSLDRFDGSTGYYLYNPRGSVTGITNEEGQIYQSYRYSVFGEITFGAPQYENEYTYNGESYNPNIKSQYLRARYYCVVTADFLTEDSYLGRITEPLTLNRYNYCVSNPLNYVDPSGNMPEWLKELLDFLLGNNSNSSKNGIKSIYKNSSNTSNGTSAIDYLAKPLPPTSTPAPTEVPNGGTVGNIVSRSPGGYLNQQVEDADENRYNTECTNLTLQYAINVLDEYLKGNVSEEYAQSCVQELAKIGALYENEYIKSVKKYKSDFKNRDYDQFDTQIIGWVAYYNYKSPEYSIDPEWVKAMLYVESVYSYSSNPSPNANASVDIMQTLDPRNSTIYTYVNVDIMQTYVAGPGYKDEKNPDYRVTVGQIRELNKLTPISQENVGGNIIPLAQTLFSFENDKYYYQYSNATQFMSLGIGIYTLQEKYRMLDRKNSIYAIPDSILQKYNIGDPDYVDKVNYLLNLDVDSGWEHEYAEKFK